MAKIKLKGDELLEEIEQTTCSPGEIAFWWLGQNGFVYKGQNRIVYIDLYLSEGSQRQIPPPLKAEKVKNADLVLCSHDHGDHLDSETIKTIAHQSSNALFIVPNPVSQRMLSLGISNERIIPLSADESKEIKGIKVTGVKAAHEFFDKHPELGFPYLGYIIEMNDVTFYHAGDTVWYEGLLTTLKKWEFDAVFLPINGRDATRYKEHCLGNMTFQEAVDLAGKLRPGLAVPMHYGMFAHNTEEPQNFVDYLEVKYSDVPSWVGKVGERVFIEAKKSETG